MKGYGYVKKMIEYTVWYSISSNEDNRSSIRSCFPPTEYPEKCAEQIAERLYHEDVNFYDSDIIIYESKDGPELGRYMVSVEPAFYVYKVAGVKWLT